MVVYRVAQEALTNVRRHAGAHEAALDLEVADDSLVLTVRDDGRGLPADAQEGAGMEARAPAIVPLSRSHRMMIGRSASLSGRSTNHRREGAMLARRRSSWPPLTSNRRRPAPV